jgi:hypothetical protein
MTIDSYPIHELPDYMKLEVEVAKKSWYQYTKWFVRHQGFAALFTGNVGNCKITIPRFVTRLPLNDYALRKQEQQQSPSSASLAHYLMTAAVASSVSEILVFPFYKWHAESPFLYTTLSTKPVNSSQTLFSEKTPRWKKFYQVYYGGCGPEITGAVVYATGTLGIFYYLQRECNPYSPHKNNNNNNNNNEILTVSSTYLSAVAARTLTVPFNTPVDIICQKMARSSKISSEFESNPVKNVIDCVKDSIKKEGVFALWHGMRQHSLRFQFFAVMMTCYDYFGPLKK